MRPFNISPVHKSFRESPTSPLKITSYPPCKGKSQRVWTQHTSIRNTRTTATSTDHHRYCQDWISIAQPCGSLTNESINAPTPAKTTNISLAFRGPRKAMTDPRHIHFSCRSTPRIEKQQPQNKYQNSFEILHIMESVMPLLVGLHH